MRNPKMDGGVVGGLPSMDYEEVIPSTFIEKDYLDHRQVYIGLHHRPGGDKSRKKQPKLSITRPPKAFRWENGKKQIKQDDDSASEAEGMDKQIHTAPASERVKFILGGDNEEEKQYTETPQLFTELEELFVYLDGNAEWKETARWYKYEEDVEEGGDRWSKPHVATLSLYSLFELRSSLMAGTVMLDMEAATLAEISDNVLDNLISCNKLDKEFRSKVRETLLCKHRHHRSAGFRRNLSNIISRKSFNNSANATNNLSNGISKMSRIPSSNLIEQNASNGTPEPTENHNITGVKLFRNYSQPAFPSTLKTQVSFDRSESLPQGGGHLIYPTPPNENEESGEFKTPAFLKRLPSNAEASNVLVGEVDFLEKPIAAFVRLSKSCVIGDLTEVPIPTRFVFVMLGPAVSQGRYHEIGRAISTLMADDVFHDVVYKAKCREDLIAGIDEFLEQVTVLPPGEWDPSIRLDPRQYHYSKNRRIIVEPKLETTLEHSDKLSEGNEASDSEKSHSIVKTQRLFGGLIQDFNLWRSRKRDYKDGLSMKCFGSGILIYLSLLAVISTIGEHEFVASHGLIGTREHMLALLICGALFSLFGGQPLLVVGFVLPLSLFDGLLYEICHRYNLEYLSFRLMTGVWVVVFLLIYVALDVSYYLRYFTRFSLEIFVVLPSLVLLAYGFVYMCGIIQAYSNQPGTFSNQSCLCVDTIFKAINQSHYNISAIHQVGQVNDTNGTTNVSATSTVTINTTSTFIAILNKTTIPTSTTELSSMPTMTSVTTQMYQIVEVVKDLRFYDCIAQNLTLKGEACMYGVYPFTSILTVSSIVLILFLTSFQHLGYLPKQVHQFFHNFAALIVVIVLSIGANQFNINIKYLQIPSSFWPDGINRTTWFVHPLGANQAWTIILALIPGFLLSSLIFIEQQLCGRYINYQCTLLKKGNGYHLDLLIICIGVLVSSLLGLPFCVASVYLSISNVISLTSQDANDFIGCDVKIREQRMSSLLVFLLVALTPTMKPFLSFIPFAVLYGLLIVVLFKTFANVQFTQRFTSLFMPKEKQPDIRYLRQVPLISVNIFTVSQVVLTIILCIIRGTLAVIAFPFLMVLLIGARLFMERMLPMQDILALDEPLPPFNCPWKRLRRFKKQTGTSEGIEKGALLADESHEDVLPDINKDLDRVNLSEELSKTAAWKQLTYAENNSPLTNNSPVDSIDGKKRRRKRSRTSKHGKDSSPVGTMKPEATEHNEVIEMNGIVDDPTEHHLQPWMTKTVEEDDVRNMDYSSRSPDDRIHSKHSRQGNDERSSMKRQRSKDRNSLRSNKSSTKNRTDTKKSYKERRNSSNKVPKTHSVEPETSALPPWEQPYHSPPRKDFGLLHIPAEDINLVPDVDPASPALQINELYSENETITTLDETTSPPVTADRKESGMSVITESPQNGSPRNYDSGDASAEFE